MQYKKSIYRYEYAMILILAQLGSVFLVSIQENVLGKDTYFALLIGLGAGLALNAVFLTLLKKTGYQPFAKINLLAFGKFGNVITRAYSAYFLLESAILLNYYSVFSVEKILWNLPVGALVISIVVLVAFSCIKGVTTMGRMGVVFSYVLLGCVAVSFLCSIPYFDGNNLYPMFQSDTGDFLWMAMLFASLQFGSLVSVLCVAPYVNQKQKLIRLSLLAALIGGGIVFLFSFINALVLGDSLIAQDFGFLRVMRLVDLGGFLTRIETIVIAGYFFATVFRLMIDFFVITNNIDTVLQKNTPRIKWGVLIGCAVVLIILSQNVPAREFGGNILQNRWFFIPAAIFQLILPVLTLALIRKPKARC